MGDGLWEVTLQDHDTSRQFVHSAETLEGVWDAVEKLLGGGKVPWRAYKSYKGPAADIPEAEDEPPVRRGRKRKK